MRDKCPIADPIIGLDATHSVGKELSGVGKYSLHLMNGLARLYPQECVRRYYRPHRWLRAPWPKHFLLDRAPNSVHVFHGLNQRLPKRGKARMVCTFHDLFVLSAEYSSSEFRSRFTMQAREAAERSDLIIAVSSFTARQVSELLNYPAERIRVVPHGVVLPATVQPISKREKIVLTVGAVQKRKNTRRLVEAFRAMPPDWQLWIAGGAGFESDSMLAELPGNVRVLGYVSDEELSQLYQRAAIFAFPSLDEGFGIPVIEAMANGLPVITSKTSALPEVAGQAARIVDPLRTEDISQALRDWIEPEARERYVASGLERAREFTWERASQLTANVYAELVQ